MYSTKPFFAGKVMETVFSQSLFDDIFVSFVKVNDFNIDQSQIEIFQNTGEFQGITDPVEIVNAVNGPHRFKIESLYFQANLKFDATALPIP
jgi:hypothetical protein